MADSHADHCHGIQDPSRAPGGLGHAPAPALAAAAAAAPPPASCSQPWGDVSLQQLRAALQHFAAERDWGQYHTPRNLLLALMGEAGELAECFQWRGEVACGLPDFTPQERHHVGEELSDVLLYLIRLADACGINLAEAALQKMQRNAAKYPADRCRGSSAKYTRYEQQQQQQAAPQPGNTAQQQPSAAVAAAGAGQPAAEPGQQHPAALQS